MSIYITHLIITGAVSGLMIWMYSRGLKCLTKSVAITLQLVYGLVMAGAMLFALRYYFNINPTHPEFLQASQVIAYFLFFGAFWHILMAIVASTMGSIEWATDPKAEEYDANAKGVVNI